jgi:cbb3-type cytochrome oxidase maturation protein
MSIIYILLPIALMLGGGFVLAFIWLASSGHFEDLETPAHRILIEDEE